MPLLTEALGGDETDVLLCLTGEEWQAVRKALSTAQDGSAMLRVALVNRDPVLGDAVNQLHSMGLCRRSRSGWQLHPRACAVLQTSAVSLKLLELADQVYAALEGYLRIYGILPARDAVNMIRPLVTGAVKTGDTADNFIIDIWRRRNGLSDLMMTPDGLWLLCPGAENVDALYAALHEPKLQMKPYASYSLEEAIACGKGAPPGRCDAYDELISFYQTHGVDREMAIDAIDQAVFLFQQNRLADVMEALCAPIATPMTPTQLRILKLIYYRAPSWLLKGSCAEDMMSPASRLNKRVRQDDPCPCGSGRRYKHCCGRLQ